MATGPAAREPIPVACALSGSKADVDAGDRARIGRAAGGSRRDRAGDALPFRPARALGGLARGERVDVGRPQGLAADRPVAAVELVDPDPGHGAHVLAFHRDHRLGHPGDELLLLLRREDVLDHVDRDERHGVSPCMVVQAWAIPRLLGGASHAGAAGACRPRGDGLEILCGFGAARCILPGVIYEFGPFELDLARVELRAAGEAVRLEPQVFALLALLVQNGERLVSKDEIIEKVWDGRVVSEAAVASRVKSARQALGDDGKSQRFIRTIHGQGYRFVSAARAKRAATAVSAERPAGDAARSGLGAMVQRLERIARPSLAVLPFRFVGDEERYAAVASALPDELITDLARVHWLFITARGSSFRLGANVAEPGEIGRLLGVRYGLWGTVEVAHGELVVIVELVDTTDGGVVWADRFSGRVDDVHAMREQMRSRVLVALEIRIPMHEAALARLAPVENLDAWSAYHLGLQHLYRFNRVDNTAAAGLFERAVTLDPCLARAHAGLSFVHFQSAFMHYTRGRADAITEARRFAERGLELDPLDPFVNFAMGRTYWLEGDLETSLGWLERATDLSPNYAQGIYARAWTEALAGRASDGRRHVDLAMRLSPLDPLHYAMQATRAFTHMVVGEDTEAAQWAERGARSPGAHVLIAMIAAAAHALKGDGERAAFWATNVRARSPALTRDDFLLAFPMQSEPMRTRLLRALGQLGF